MDANFLRRLVHDRILACELRKGDVARRAGISREMLYKFLSGDSDLGISNVLKLLAALGLRAQIVPDFRPMPKNYRARKSQKQAAYLARREPVAAFGVAHGAKIRAVHVPNLDGDL